jgi:hypothetical protein
VWHGPNRHGVQEKTIPEWGTPCVRQRAAQAAGGTRCVRGRRIRYRGRETSANQTREQMSSDCGGRMNDVRVIRNPQVLTIACQFRSEWGRFVCGASPLRRRRCCCRPAITFTIARQTTRARPPAALTRQAGGPMNRHGTLFPALMRIRRCLPTAAGHDPTNRGR